MLGAPASSTMSWRLLRLRSSHRLSPPAYQPPFENQRPEEAANGISSKPSSTSIPSSGASEMSTIRAGGIAGRSPSTLSGTVIDSPASGLGRGSASPRTGSSRISPSKTPGATGVSAGSGERRGGSGARSVSAVAFTAAGSTASGSSAEAASGLSPAAANTTLRSTRTIVVLKGAVTFLIRCGTRWQERLTYRIIHRLRHDRFHRNFRQGRALPASPPQLAAPEADTAAR